MRKSESRCFAKLSKSTTVLVLMVLLLISTTGCSRFSRSIVVVEGEQTVQVRKATLDNLYNDNEHLIRVIADLDDKLERCMGEK